MNQKLAIRLLEQMGYRVDLASNGIEVPESVARETYTCIGKTVNQASLLEAHTKVAGETILLDAETPTDLQDPDACKPINAAEFKGFADALDVFAL